MARDRHLQHTKGLRTTTGRGAPSPNEGSDGDMTIRSLGRGLFLFVKFGNFWYHVSELVSYNPKKVHPNKIKPVNILPGGVQGGGGSKDLGITAGSKLILSSINTREGISGNNYIQSGTVQTSADLGNLFSRDFTKFTVGERTMLILDENSSGSRILAGTNNNPSAIEAKVFYVANTYGASSAYTKITTDHATSLILTAGDADNQYSVYIKENGGGANDYTAFPALSKVFLDGGFNTYIQESSADHISMVAGGVTTFVLDNTSAIFGANQYLTITDNEIDVSSGDLTLDSAGILLLDAASGDANQGVQFLLDGTRVGDITAHHANTYFILYENGGASTSDYFAIKCGANGDSDIITVDAAGSTAHLNITPDGQLTLNPVSTLTFQPTGALMIRKSMFQLEQASADADQVAYGQIWVKNATPNELYFTNDAGNDIQITSGSSMAGGGGGTDTWETTVGGYKTNNNSSTYYYTQYYSGYHTWTRSDTTPTSIDDYAVYTSVFTAQKDGTLTSIKFMGRASDTGVTDPFKVYVYKAAPAHGDTTTTATLIGTSSTITPGGTLRNVVSTTAISSSNTFSAGDSLYVWYKKDSTSGSQDLYFQISISGEYD